MAKELDFKYLIKNMRQFQYFLNKSLIIEEDDINTINQVANKTIYFEEDEKKKV